jgi:hypothetical protein
LHIKSLIRWRICFSLVLFSLLDQAHNISQTKYCTFNVLNQRFSTWGTGTPRGTWGSYRGYAKSPQGYAKFKKPHPNEAYLGRIFYLGVHLPDSFREWQKMRKRQKSILNLA